MRERLARVGSRLGRTRERIDATETLGSINVRSGDQIEVGRRNWVTSNPTSVLTLVLSSASLLLALFLR